MTASRFSTAGSPGAHQRDGADAAAVRVRTALEGAAAALARPDLDTLLAVEGALSAAFADLSMLRALGGEERRAVRDELLAAQTALRRARGLGGALNDFIGLTLQAYGHSVGYDPARMTAATLSGRGVHVRV